MPSVCHSPSVSATRRQLSQTPTLQIVAVSPALANAPRAVHIASHRVEALLAIAAGIGECGSGYGPRPCTAPAQAIEEAAQRVYARASGTGVARRGSPSNRKTPIASGHPQFARAFFRPILQS